MQLCIAYVLPVDRKVSHAKNKPDPSAKGAQANRHTKLGPKGVNFGNSLTGSGICYMGSEDEDVVKYFGEKMCFPILNLIWN